MFKSVDVDSNQLAALNYTLVYNPNTLFGRRLGDHCDKKKAVALGMAKLVGEDGIGVIVTDGSSTFPCAIALAANRTGVRIRTNNLAIPAEFANRPAAPQAEVEVIAGRYDSNLMATFPSGEEFESEERKVRDFPLAVVSVREFFVQHGPTSPDQSSRVFKKLVFSAECPIIIPMTWDKLSAVQPHPATRVFVNTNDWKQFFDNRDIQMYCDKPDGIKDSVSEGQRVAARRFHPGDVSWDTTGAALDRYRWSVYQLSLMKNVLFVEVKIV
jgi:DeoR/GlpR family transcriptional regulator of sugar metabolism